MKRKIPLLFLLYFFLIGPALALDQSELAGYTLIDEKIIDGDFEGCDFDKRIIFMDGTYLTCSTYSYTYSYMPTAYIYGRQFKYERKVFIDIKMVVEDEIYDMYPIILSR